MVECFGLSAIQSRWLRATNTNADGQVSVCPVNREHRTWNPTGDDVELRHSKRDQWLISSTSDGFLVHARLAEEFEKRGFTGYTLRPATVRFRDGDLSRDYWRFVVTGSAGVASPDSGMELLEACPGCEYRRFGPLKHPEKLIDWTQWTGADFFTVEPYRNRILITKRVADVLEELRVKSYQLESLQTVTRRIAEGPSLEMTPGEVELRQISAKIRGSDGAGRRAALGELLELTGRDPSIVGHVVHRFLNWLQRHMIQSQDLVPFAPLALQTWDVTYRELKPRQQSSCSTTWQFDDQYSEHRDRGGLLLDFLGYTPISEARSALREGLGLSLIHI